MTELLDKHKIRNKKSLSGDLIIYIKQQILLGFINPGERIVETRIAKELGISQTPIREAIRHLAGEGIVTIVPNKGPHVRILTSRDIFEIYSLRIALESLAIKLAILNSSEEDIAYLEDFFEKMRQKVKDESVTSLAEDSAFIHNYIYQLSKHTWLMAMNESISFQISLVNREIEKRYSKQKEVDEHTEILEVLKQRDPKLAEHIMKQHIYRTYQNYLEFNQLQSNITSEHLLL